MAKRTILYWGICVLAPVLVYFSCPATVSPQFPLFMALTTAAVAAWATNVLPSFVVAASVTFAYIIFGVAAPQVALGPWTTVMPWITFGALVVGIAMERTNLAKRLALYCLRLTGGTFNGLVLGFTVAGLVLVIILPSVLARLVVTCAIAVGIIDTLGIDSKSRMSSAIIMLAFFAAAGPLTMFMHASEACIWAFDMMFKGTDIKVDFWEYMRHMTMVGAIYYAVSLSVVYIVKGRAKLQVGSEIKKYVSDSFASLGPMSAKEIKLLLLALAVIAGFMVQKYTNINPIYIFCGLMMLCFFPFVDILHEKDVRDINLTIMVFVTGCMAIGFVGDKVGASAWVVGELMPFLKSMGVEGATFCAYVFGVLVNFLLTPLAAMAAFVPSFAELGRQMQINPVTLFYSFSWGTDQYILPYEAVYYLYIFVTGKVLVRHVAFAMFVRMVLIGLVVAFIAIPYWKMIGLI